ncbi:MAG: hypothetical protein ABI167_11855 [Nitrosospira sp.]
MRWGDVQMRPVIRSQCGTLKGKRDRPILAVLFYALPWLAPGRTHQTEGKRLLSDTPMGCAFVGAR